MNESQASVPTKPSKLSQVLTRRPEHVRTPGAGKSGFLGKGGDRFARSTTSRLRKNAERSGCDSCRSTRLLAASSMGRHGHVLLMPNQSSWCFIVSLSFGPSAQSAPSPSVRR